MSASAKNSKARPWIVSARFSRGSPKFRRLYTRRLGHIESVPRLLVSGLAKIRDHAGEATRSAEGMSVFNENSPVTDVLLPEGWETATSLQQPDGATRELPDLAGMQGDGNNSNTGYFRRTRVAGSGHSGRSSLKQVLTATRRVVSNS